MRQYFRGSRWRGKVLVLLLGVTLLVPTGAADANFGSTAGCGYLASPPNSGPTPPTNCVRLANNIWHAVRFAGLGNANGWANMDDDLEWVIDSRLDATDLVAYRNDSDPVPDVWAMDNNYGYNLGIVAWVDCPANNSGTGGSGSSLWCRGQYLRFNSYYEGLVGNRILACHELGHTVGLKHNTHPAGETYDSCMRTSPVLDRYSSHERYDHINSTY